MFLQRFENGEAAPADGAAIIDALARSATGPVTAKSSVITTTDGEADVYGLTTAADGLMFNHASGSAIWEVIVATAMAADLAILAPGIPACVTREKLLRDLPEALRGDARVVGSGRDLLDVIRGARERSGQ